MTFTPLQGVSTVVKRFLHEKSEDRHKTIMTIDDVQHYSDDEKKTIIASYPAHEAEARVKGIPVLGSGRIFPDAEENISIDQRDFPSHWPRIGGMDFGWDHPFAAVELVWDRDSNTVYVSKTHRLKEASPVIHAATLRAWGKNEAAPRWNGSGASFQYAIVHVSVAKGGRTIPPELLPEP